jgi:hypothetical protein
MAELLESFEFKRSGGGNGGTKHPWHEWMDGQCRRLTAEDFGAATLRTIATSAHRMAKKAGKKVHLAVNKEENSIVMQAYVPVMADPELPNEEGDEKVGDLNGQTPPSKPTRKRNRKHKRDA